MSGAHLAALAALDGVGPSRLRWLVEQGAPEDVWAAVLGGRMGAPPGPRGGSALLHRWRSQAAEAPQLPGAMQRRIDSLGLDVLTGNRIPGFLRDDPDPPCLLFCRGSMPEAMPATVAIVGTRRASSYGLRMAAALGRELSAAGVIVVSGLALGIDGAAHRGALEGPGAALAVIGAGHDRPCPTRNRSLAAEVAARGLILSEVPPGVGSAPWRYPVRNRLIAALARVVIVVESASRGGSMSTVAEALARDRAVMAVPGAVGRRSSEGCHDLLRDGAEVCTGADDVLGLLAMNQAGCGSPDSEGGVARPGLSGLERQVLEELAGDPLTVDSLVLRTGTSMGRIAGVLAGLEARGRIRSRSGWLERT